MANKPETNPEFSNGLFVPSWVRDSPNWLKIVLLLCTLLLAAAILVILVIPSHDSTQEHLAPRAPIGLEDVALASTFTAQVPTVAPIAYIFHNNPPATVPSVISNPWTSAPQGIAKNTPMDIQTTGATPAPIRTILTAAPYSLPPTVPPSSTPSTMRPAPTKPPQTPKPNPVPPVVVVMNMMGHPKMPKAPMMKMKRRRR